MSPSSFVYASGGYIEEAVDAVDNVDEVEAPKYEFIDISVPLEAILVPIWCGCVNLLK